MQENKFQKLKLSGKAKKRWKPMNLAGMKNAREHILKTKTFSQS
jgi:hypothetical protein